MKILVYDDNPDFGGHQIMACRGIEALASEPAIEITCMLNPANRELVNHLSGFKMRSPTGHLDPVNIDMVLCIQGDTRQSVRGVLAAKKTGIPCISYLALPHSMAEMGAKLGSIRDRLALNQINAPDRYITISENMKQILVNRGCEKNITVVPNGIPRPSTHHTETLAPNPTLGLLGRIEFKQKQQNFMIRTFLQFPDVFKGCRLLIAGSGPDQHKLEKIIAGMEHIEFIPWQSDPEAFYAQTDFLLLPSRYEGVPLVMLEALARGIPVIGSNCDGMKELLPASWTFEPGNAQALANTFVMVRKNWKKDIEPLRETVLTENALTIFQNRFLAAVAGQ